MPIHFNDRDVVSEVAGLHSALIVTCKVCPAATVAVREGKPFLELLKGPMKSKSFQGYLEDMQARLGSAGVEAKVFKNNLYHQWFLCMWPEGRRKKLHAEVKNFDSVVVLGCESATKTVRDSIGSNGCKVIEGMEVAGIMNATLRIGFTGSVYFEDCEVGPLSNREKNEHS